MFSQKTDFDDSRVQFWGFPKSLDTAFLSFDASLETGLISVVFQGYPGSRFSYAVMEIGGNYAGLDPR